MHSASAPMLEIKDLQVFYGQAHALQGVSLTLDQGILAVVGRNGMGKTTLCNAIMGLVPAKGSIRIGGKEIVGLTPHQIVALGLGYVPQGRRVWPSLSVDEHLRLTARSGRSGSWTVGKIYDLFPRLAERKGQGGGQLSGGEQQMLAIGRALLAQPSLLIMDEPTEGLAPVIVTHVSETLKTLAAENRTSILLVEQNLGVAIDVSDDVAIMVGGRIARVMRTDALAADSQLQHRLLGVKSSEESDFHAGTDETSISDVTEPEPPTAQDEIDNQPIIGAAAPTAWSGANAHLRAHPNPPRKRDDEYRGSIPAPHPLSGSGDRACRLYRGHIRHQSPGAHVHQSPPGQTGIAHCNGRCFHIAQALAHYHQSH